MLSSSHFVRRDKWGFHVRVIKLYFINIEWQFSNSFSGEIEYRVG